MDKTFLKKMIECISPSGREEMLQKEIYANYKNDFDEFVVEEQGTLTGISNKDATFKVLLAGHSDEISLIVSGYNNDGSLTVSKNGGIRPRLYAGTKVQILTNDGVVKGVVGTNGAINKNPDLQAEDLFVDLGCKNIEEAKKLVPMGSYVVHDTDMIELQNNMLAARAFDDKIGVYIVFEAAKKAIKNGSKIGIYATSTTGEETTGRGAYSASSLFKPSLAISVDVTFANDYIGAAVQGDVRIGSGGVLCHGSIPNKKVNEMLAICAKELGLPIQYEISAGRTGTDSDTMIKTNEGVPQALFSIPLRYMHSPIEVLSIDDVDSMIEILALFLTKIQESTDLKPYNLDC